MKVAGMMRVSSLLGSGGHRSAHQLPLTLVAAHLADRRLALVCHTER